MKTTMEQLQTLHTSLGYLQEQLLAKGDAVRAAKVQDLRDKCERRQMDMTFCGHFSAGKSSLINRLCGVQILPSSPIPTTANVITVENGEEEVLVERLTQDTVRVNLEQLAEACRNGNEFKRVHIRYPVPLLQDRARLIDTPGVDSTDEAHREATEAALHLADAVFYVMDYNHVLSELNFGYIRKLADYRKPLYLIVNQIDKHRETELAFPHFREQVERSLQDWNIDVDGLLFVSLKVEDHPYNEWPLLTQFIETLIVHYEEMLLGGVRKAAMSIIDEHESWLLEEQRELRADLAKRAEKEIAATAEDDRLASVETKIASLDQAWAYLEEHGKKEMLTLLSNANIIPAPSRDMVQAYLQTRRAGFRIGLLFSERKTSAEREKRLEAMRAEIESQTEANLKWHAQESLKRMLNLWELDEKTYARALQVVDELTVPITGEQLASFVVSDGHFDDGYTLHYTKVVAEHIKGEYRSRIWQALEQLAAILRPEYEAKRQELLSVLSNVKSKYAAQEELTELDKQLASHVEALQAEFAIQVDQEGREAKRHALRATILQQLQEYRAELPRTNPNGRSNHEPSPNRLPEWLAKPAEQLATSGEWHHSNVKNKLLAVADTLQQAIDLIRHIPVLSSFVDTLQAKAERLKQNRYTVALFGAFSAGKSSFANALLHTDVLPVSPNPTTAAINSVLPPIAEQNDSVKAILHYKSAEAMHADIQQSLEKLRIAQPKHTESLVEAIADVDLSGVHIGGKVHVAFLKAVKQGWNNYASMLGTAREVDLETYQAAVADEAHACYLDSVDLYLDSPFAKQDMILVDTPGADSINARHTGVAFHYIKNADAILFVTYYNHAFSQADREFLLQLGRVKDSFALNKMFFIVNAADLAQDEEELAEVIRHVNHNLTTLGLRDPRIYPVSSLMAREAAAAQDENLRAQSGIARFEADFFTFVREELADLSIHSSLNELQRAQEAFAGWLDRLKQAELDRDAEIEQINRGAKAAEQWLQNVSYERLQDDLAKEIQELIYYVAQRVSYRFGELYNLAFNPSLFADPGLPDKEKLNLAYEELLEYLRFDLEQELRATTLRIENFIQRHLADWHHNLSAKLADELSGFMSSEFDPPAWASPPCDVALPEHADEWKAVRGAYRSSRQFFEQGGKDRLKQTIESMLHERVKGAAAEGAVAMQTYYQQAMNARLTEMNEKLLKESKQYAEGILQSLQETVDLAAYEDKYQQLIALGRQHALAFSQN